MDTRFNIINGVQDLTEINFLLGDNQPGERGSFKIGDFVKTSLLPLYTFRIEKFGFNTNQAGLSVPTDIYFNMWDYAELKWDDSTSLSRDISPGEDFLKTMEKTDQPQSGGKRKIRRKKRIFRYNVMTLRKHRKSRKRKSGKSRKRKSRRSRRKSRKSRRKSRRKSIKGGRRKSKKSRSKSRRKSKSRKNHRRRTRRKMKGGRYQQYGSNIPNTPGYSGPNTKGPMPWATGPVGINRQMNC